MNTNTMELNMNEMEMVNGGWSLKGVLKEAGKYAGIYAAAGGGIMLVVSGPAGAVVGAGAGALVGGVGGALIGFAKND